MEWLRTHPYTSALCAAGALALVGAFIVTSRATQPAGTQATTWRGGVVSLLNPTSYGPEQSLPPDDESFMQQVRSGPPYTYIAPDFSVSASSGEEGAYDFEAFLAKLAAGSAASGQADTNGDDAFLSAYAYIPRGLISTTTSRSARTPLQQELYEYGNDVGSTIESFEQQHSNTVQILKDQVEDRASPQKAAAVVSIGHDLEAMGNTLAAMERVPPVIASAHAALAQSYIEIGRNLALIPGAERDSDFIKAIQTYNASADTFTANYIQLISLFGAHGVTFSSSDGGKVFTFTPAGF